MSETISRKEFFQKCALMGLAVTGGASLLAACGGGESGSSGTAQKTTAQTGGAADPCGDTTGLNDTDLQMRSNLKYVAKSAEEGKNCANCKFYLADQHGESCGGCQLFKGPVSPEGNCSSWFAKEQG